MKSAWTRRLWWTVLGVGASLTAAAGAQAQYAAPGQPYYVPMPPSYGWNQPYNPYYSYQPYALPAPAYNPYQFMTRPGPMPAAPTGTLVAQPKAPLEAPQMPATLPLTDPTPAAIPAAPCAVPTCPPPAEPCTLCVASPPWMLGRDDAYNRFNDFDNMTALPANHVWFGYRAESNFNPGVITGDPVLQVRQHVNLYRFGVEIAPCGFFSVSFQNEYIDSTGSPDSWGNPDVMVKLALLNDECRVVSLVCGVQPQVSTSADELHERTTRITPGLLFFRGFGDYLFVQGGAQVGVTTNDAPETVDYVLSVGGWLWRDPRYDVAGQPIQNCCQDTHCHRFIAGVMPQFEVLGTNVIANRRGVALTTSTVPAAFLEGRDVVDLTMGGRILFTPYVSLGSAYSLPVTGTDVRRGELITSLNVSF